MDTLRGNFAGRDDLDEAEAYDPAEDDAGRDAPPPGIGQDERRMQVRAYNLWASLLEDRNFPSIDDLDPENLPDFGPYSVLLDFTAGIEDPGISYLGEELAAECGTDAEISRLSDVPSRSLLSRITDHYMQILANQAPIGFEAEFVNQRGATILYRGILLPFSSDDDTIDFIYGVINWKEVADQQTADELMLEIGQAIDEPADGLPEQREIDAPMPDWADGPAASDSPSPGQDDAASVPETAGGGPAPGASAIPAPSFGATGPAEDWTADETALPAPSFGGSPTSGAPPEIELEAAMDLGREMELRGGSGEAEPADTYAGPGAAPGAPGQGLAEITLPELDESEMGLGDWLASARELAMAARTSEDRTRNALYEAISRAYDFSLAAAGAPEEFAELVADSGLTMQERAPMTPVVKLVFGADYDKTRLTEYACALSHAHRIGLGRGELGAYLRKAEGGLKGVVTAERRWRRELAGGPGGRAQTPGERLAARLRSLPPLPFAEIPSDGQEFGLVIIRRLPDGEVVALGEVPDDVALIERAARKLLG